MNKDVPKTTKEYLDEIECLHRRIAELEVSESRLKQDNERFGQILEYLDSVLESLPYPFYVIDAFNYTISIANSATDFERLSKDSTCYALMHHANKPCESAEYPCPIKKIKKTKKPITVEHTHYDKDGNPKVVEVNAYPVFDSENNVQQIIECSLDITDRKQAEEALRESKERYRSLFDSSINPTNLLDRDGSFLMINQAAARLLGGSPDDFVGKSIYELLPANAKGLMEKHQQAFESGSGEEFEVLMELPSGERWFLSTVDPIKDAKGEVFAVQVISYDITDRKQAEEALEESAQKIKLFAYSVSHDLKNPAIGIYGLTKLLHKNYKHILDEKGRDYCERILKASEQLATLVEQINIYISTKESPLVIESVKLQQVIEMVRHEFASQINIRRISWSQPESIPEINVDKISILRVVRNFVDNALKYGGDELTEINISYEESNDFHILSVKDDGIGIAEEDSKRIFGLFQRNVTSRGIEGTGLGLAIAKEIAEQHKGKVWAEPGLEKGTIFYISISKHLKLSNVHP